VDALTGRRPRVVFVTPEEPSVMPVFFEKVIPPLREQIAAVAVVSPIYKKSSWLRQAKRFAGSFGLRELVVEGLHYGYYRAADRIATVVPVCSPRAVKSIARAHRLRVLTPRDVNAPDFLRELRELDPDLVISVSCPQIFRTELLELPRFGCINVHSALLPYYRGMLPTFWVLAKGENESGVTVHHMTPGIDGGDIILQRRIPISTEETLHSLMRKSKSLAGDLILETVSRFEDGSVPGSPNPAHEGSYFSFPGRQDVLEFKARGRTLR
jgi:methionyl-tRNA formyltransferase